MPTLYRGLERTHRRVEGEEGGLLETTARRLPRACVSNEGENNIYVGLHASDDKKDSQNLKCCHSLYSPRQLHPKQTFNHTSNLCEVHFQHISCSFFHIFGWWCDGTGTGPETPFVFGCAPRGGIHVVFATSQDACQWQINIQPLLPNYRCTTQERLFFLYPPANTAKNLELTILSHLRKVVIIRIPKLYIGETTYSVDGAEFARAPRNDYSHLVCPPPVAGCWPW